MNAYLFNVIDMDAWNAAKWVATAYLHAADDAAPPLLGLVFDHEAPALQIFDGWRKSIGVRDEKGILRVSIIEGPIPSKEPGYTVHIGPNREQSIKRIEASGKPIEGQQFMFLSRFCRMNPPAGSQHLSNFKKSLAKHGSYAILPLSGGLKNPKQHLDRMLEMAGLTFRTTDQIVAPEDPDYIILGKAVR